LGNAFRTQNLVKPQLAFDIKPNNDDNAPWKPLLTSKPHATVSLEESLRKDSIESEQQYDYIAFLPLLILPPSPATPEGLSKSQRKAHNKRIAQLKIMGSTRSALVIDNTDNYFRYKHPYETEILQLKYPDAVYQKADPIQYLPVESTSAIFVDTEQGVLEMLAELKQANAIAVDLEHHDTRSYVGLVSLMQISTRNKDWIVDTLKPWRQNLQILNEVFTDPKIVKVP
jgi:exosome complex exonuclease RRP6